MNKPLLKQALDALKDVTQTLACKQWDIDLGYTDKMQSTEGAITIGKTAITAMGAELAKPDQPDYAPGTSVFVDGVLVAWFAIFDEAAQEWCTENHFGQWTTWQANAPVTIPITPDELKRIESEAMDIAAKLREPETRNCSRHPDAPHGPDGAGCKCHNWTPGEAS